MANESLQLFSISTNFKNKNDEEQLQTFINLKVCTDGKVHHNPAETRFVMFQGAERFLSG